MAETQGREEKHCTLGPCKGMQSNNDKLKKLFFSQSAVQKCTLRQSQKEQRCKPSTTYWETTIRWPTVHNLEKGKGVMLMVGIYQYTISMQIGPNVALGDNQFFT